MPILERLLPRQAGRLRRPLRLAVAAGTVAGAVAIAQADLLSRTVDAVFLRGAGLAAVTPFLLGLATAASVRAGAIWSQEAAAAAFSGAVRVAVRDRLTRRLLALGPRVGFAERSGELANTAVGGVDSLDAYLAQYLPLTYLAALVPTLVLLAVLRTDTLSGLVLLLTGPLVPLFMWLIGGAAAGQARRQWVTLSRLSARFLDALQGLPTLRAFGQADHEAAALERVSDHYRTVTLKVLRLAFLSALVLEALATLGTAVVAVEVGLRLLYARLGFREALFVLVLAPEFYRPLRALGGAFHAGTAGREASSRIGAVLEAPGPLAAPAVLIRPRSPAAPASPGRGRVDDGRDAPPQIAFESVRFAYGPGRPPALADLTLDLPAGEALALVGPSGAGKTTVAHLLLRFLEPDAGLVRVDGRSVGEMAPEEWRRCVAWVPQQPRLFHGTIRENVLLARPEASAERLERAAALARLDAVLSGRPRGWEAAVGEGGERLSGGEARRVALARAFLKDSPVLVLDEPTAQLDAVSETGVLEAIAQLRRGRTVLLVAHRLSTAVGADRVAVLAGGRVQETGPPQVLARAGGPFSRLLRASEGAS